MPRELLAFDQHSDRGAKVVALINQFVPTMFRELALAEAQRSYDWQFDHASHQGFSDFYASETSMNAARITAAGYDAVRWHVLHSEERRQQGLETWAKNGPIAFGELLQQYHASEKTLLIAGIPGTDVDRAELRTQLVEIAARHTPTIVALSNLPRGHREVVVEWGANQGVAFHDVSFAVKPSSPNLTPQQLNDVRRSNLNGVEYKIRHAISFMNPSSILLLSERDPVSTMIQSEILAYMDGNHGQLYTFGGNMQSAFTRHAETTPISTQPQVSRSLFGSRAGEASTPSTLIEI